MNTRTIVGLCRESNLRRDEMMDGILCSKTLAGFELALLSIGLGFWGAATLTTATEVLYLSVWNVMVFKCHKEVIECNMEVHLWTDFFHFRYLSFCLFSFTINDSRQHIRPTGVHRHMAINMFKKNNSELMKCFCGTKTSWWNKA